MDWAVRSVALLLRSRLEAHRHRTAHRAAAQLQVHCLGPSAPALVNGGAAGFVGSDVAKPRTALVWRVM